VKDLEGKLGEGFTEKWYKMTDEEKKAAVTNGEIS
jgi:hypothetical protein